jgi:hypothetical protein
MSFRKLFFATFTNSVRKILLLYGYSPLLNVYFISSSIVKLKKSVENVEFWIIVSKYNNDPFSSAWTTTN